MDALEAVAGIGAGAWGTSLACVLGERYRDVTLWVYEADLAKAMARTRENAIAIRKISVVVMACGTVRLSPETGGAT